MILVLSCEHGGNKIPTEFEYLFAGSKSMLKSHCGYDPGTLDLFNYLAPLATFSKSNSTSRLLIECNRSLHHPSLFSEFSKVLDRGTKNDVVNTYYQPYRSAVQTAIDDQMRRQAQVLHISLHSFVPKLDDEIRVNDIGLLYDPKRQEEKLFCRQFKEKLQKADPSLKIRLNYPYLGSADGFTTYLRKQFPDGYLGIELEINQALVVNHKFPMALKKILKSILIELTNELK